MCAEVPPFRGFDEGLLRCAGRKVGLGFVGLKACIVEPGGEEHLHGSAAKPVSLFVVRTDAADAGAVAFRDDGGERLVAARSYAKLPLCRGGTADEADFPGGPGERGHPIEFIVGISERDAEDVVVTFREVAAAFIHLDESVAVLDGVERGGQIARGAERDVPVVEVVGSAREDDGIFFGLIFGAIDISLHAFAVAHGDHDFSFDDGHGFEFMFNGIAAGDGSSVTGGAGLRLGTKRTYKTNESDDRQLESGMHYDL